jgi:hypothetical protein
MKHIISMLYVKKIKPSRIFMPLPAPLPERDRLKKAP